MINLIKVLHILLFMSQAFANEFKSYEQQVEDLRKAWGNDYLNEWKIYINAKEGTKLEELGIAQPIEYYAIPDLEFYKSPTLEGKIYGEINKKGVFINGQLICTKKRASARVGEKENFYDYFARHKIIDGLTGNGNSCGGIPITSRWRAEFHVVTTLHLKNINKNIGETLLFGEKVYVDIKKFLKKPIRKPTKLTLKEHYGEEFKEIDKVLNNFREMLLTKNVKALNEYFFKPCYINLPENVRSYRKKKCNKKINSRDFSYYKKNKYLEVLFYESNIFKLSRDFESEIYLSSPRGGTAIVLHKNDEEQGTPLTSGTDEQKPVSNNNQDSDDNEPDDDILIDSDGDFVTDLQEKELGRNPNIADMPIIRTRFLQHYKITVSYKSLSDGKKGSFVIDTKKISDDPSFKYRVGEIFFRNNSLKSAALIGRFNGHSHGEYEEHDFTWVTYPEIDSRYFLDQTMKYRRFFDTNKYDIENINLEFESSLRLKANSSFDEIKNPLLTFRFYNYETENYEVIHSEMIERSILSGVNELITTKIDNVEPKLVRENFFQKGEFIISELTDYEIPSLGRTFSNLKASVKEKTLPVVYNTPLETTLKYVAVGEGKSFSEVMKHLFDDNFVVENERITSIYQFRNSIPKYQRLNELRAMDKKGDWFIFTNPLNMHYLDHTYTKDDVISLSYFLGAELATQDEEKVFSYREAITSSNEHKTYPMGNITSNSILSFILKPLTKSGDELIPGGGEFRNQGCGGRRNCVSYPFLCGVRIHGFKPFSKGFSFNQSFSGELSRITLIINQNEYKLNKLFEEKKIKTQFNGANLIVTIDDIGKIQAINDVDENIIFLRAYGKSQTYFDGVKLEKAEGRGWYNCPRIVADLAHNNKLPVNTDSVKFGEWAHWFNWNVLGRSKNRTIHESFNFGLSSVIFNRFN